MADTLGDIRYRLSKTPGAVGIDQDYLDAVINERYLEILRSYPWKRLIVDAILQTTALYDTGTVAVTNGSASITGTDTVWTAAMTGRFFRVDGRNEYYTFTRTAATTGTLDRVYEGDDDTDATYRIFQSVYALASDVGVLQSIKVFESDRELDQISQEELDQIDPSRLKFGNAETFALFEDDSSTPPVSQVELYPVPEDSRGYPYRYEKRVSRLSAPSDYVLPWVSTECLIAGVKAELGLAPEDRFMYLLGEMKKEETRRIPSKQIQMHERFTIHRKERALGWSLDEKRRQDQMP